MGLVLLELWGQELCCQQSLWHPFAVLMCATVHPINSGFISVYKMVCHLLLIMMHCTHLICSVYEHLAYTHTYIYRSPTQM